MSEPKRWGTKAPDSMEPTKTGAWVEYAEWQSEHAARLAAENALKNYVTRLAYETVQAQLTTMRNGFAEQTTQIDVLQAQLAAESERGAKLEGDLSHAQGLISRLQDQRYRLYKKLRDIKDVVDAAQSLMAWCVKNVNKWHFHEYDALHRAIAAYQSSKENGE